MRHVAILSPTASLDRQKFWREVWGGVRVPVMSNEPNDIIFPNGERGPGYFVNFDALGAEGCGRFHRYTQSKANAQKVLSMAATVGYPVKCDDVTIVSTELPHVYCALAAEGWC